MVFEDWLGARLRQIEADEDVFRPYIVGILEGDDDEDAKAAAVEDLLQGLAGDDELVRSILSKWNESKLSMKASAAEEDLRKATESLDLSARLTSIAEDRSAAYTAARATSDADGPDKSVKEAILAQYSGVVEEEYDEEEGEAEGGEEVKNLNADAVTKAEHEKREKAKAAAAAKKEKDKEDRENQKKQAEERKKKAQEKAAKGERRR